MPSKNEKCILCLFLMLQPGIARNKESTQKSSRPWAGSGMSRGVAIETCFSGEGGLGIHSLCVGICSRGEAGKFFLFRPPELQGALPMLSVFLPSVGDLSRAVGSWPSGLSRSFLSVSLCCVSLGGAFGTWFLIGEMALGSAVLRSPPERPIISYWLSVTELASYSCLGPFRRPFAPLPPPLCLLCWLWGIPWICTRTLHG